MITDKELKEGLEEDIRREIIVVKIKLQQLNSERIKPKTIGKGQAEDELVLWKKKLVRLEKNLKDYENYDI